MATPRFIPITLQLNTRTGEVALRTFGGEFKKLENESRGFGRTATQSFLSVEREAQRAARGTQSAFTNALSSIKSSASGLGGTLRGALSFAGGGAILNGITALTGGLGNMAGAVFDIRDQLERAEVGFTTLFDGNKEKAKGFINELRQFSKSTPFELGGTVGSAQSLLAQGFNKEQIIPILRGVGSATAAAGKGSQEFQSILSQLSQTASKGKAELEDLKIIAEAGVPVFDILSKSIGVSQEQLFKFLSEGRLRGKETVQLLSDEFARKFPSALDDLAKTTKGRFTNTVETLSGAAVDVLEPAFVGLNEVLAETNKLLEGPGFANFSAKARGFADTTVQSLRSTIQSLFAKPGDAPRAGDTALQLGGEVLTGEFFNNLPGKKGLDKLTKGESVSVKDFIDVSAEIEAIQGIGRFLGGAIPDGVKQGIKDKIKSAQTEVTEFGGSLWKSFKDSLGIQSPSKKMQEAAKFVPLGVALGLQDPAALARIAEATNGMAILIETGTLAAIQRTRRRIAEALRDIPEIRAFLDTISKAEGANYNTLFGGGKFSDFDQHPNQRITRKLGGKNITSTAAGRYQYLNKTFTGVAKQLGLPDFSPDSQDLGAIELLRQRGIVEPLLANNLPLAFMRGNREWASFPSSPYGQPTRSEKELTNFFNTRLGAQQKPPTLADSVNVTARETVSVSDAPSLGLIPLKEVAAIKQETQRTFDSIKTAAASTNTAIASTTGQLASTTQENFRRIVRDAEQTTKEVRNSFTELRDGIRESFKGAFDQLLQGDVKGAGKSLLQSLGGVGRNALTNLVFGNGQNGGGNASAGGGFGNAISQAVTGGLGIGGNAPALTGGFSGGNPAGQILNQVTGGGGFGKFNVGGLLGKVPGFSKLGSLLGIGSKAAATGASAATAGAAGAAGTAAGSGGFLSTLFGGGGAALFSNPVTAIVGGALVAAPFILGLFADRTFNRFRNEVKQQYQIEVDKKQEGRSLFQSAEQVGKTAFGKQYKSKIPELVQLRPVKEQIAQYGFATGQERSSLVRQFINKQKVGDPDDPQNQVVRREFGGPVLRGQTVLVGERRPEIFVAGSDGNVFPSIAAYERQLIAALQKRAAGGFFGGAFSKLAAQIESSAFARSGSSATAGAGSGGFSDSLVLGVMAEIAETLREFKTAPAGSVLEKAMQSNPNAVARAMVTSFSNASPESKQVAKHVRGYK